MRGEIGSLESRHRSNIGSWFFGRRVRVAERYRFISLIPDRRSEFGLSIRDMARPLFPVLVFRSFTLSSSYLTCPRFPFSARSRKDPRAPF
jgi:hypothetical protein